MGGDMFAFAVVFMAIFAVISYLAKRRPQASDQRLAAWAASRGWTYSPGDPALAKRWTGPPFVTDGQVDTVISGRSGALDFTTFGYEWTENSGENSVTRHQMLAAVRLPAALPLLWIYPQDFTSRFTNPLGASTITFESAEFNSRFTVTADNDRYAYSVVQPTMMAYLMDTSAGRAPIRIEGNHALTWIDGPYNPELATGLAGLLTGFVSRIPSFVYDQNATTAATGWAGSVSGLRPEATRADLVKTVFIMVWGVIWVGISSTMAYFTYALPALSPSGWEEWAWLIPAAFVLIGLVVVSGALVQLARGGYAIWHNGRVRRGIPSPQ